MEQTNNSKHWDPSFYGAAILIRTSEEKWSSSERNVIIALQVIQRRLECDEKATNAKSARKSCRLKQSNTLYTGANKK